MKRCGLLRVGVLAGLAAILWSLAGCSGMSVAQLTGTVSYRERMALPAGSEIRVALEQQGAANTAPTVVAEQTINPSSHPPAAVPIPFAISYDRNAVVAGGHYLVVAEIRSAAGKVLWRGRQPVDPEAAPQGGVNLVLTRIGATALRPWHFHCDDIDFTLVPRGDYAELVFDNRVVRVERMPSGSGVRYKGSDVMFWSKGRNGMLTLGGHRYEGCTGEPQ